MHNELTSRVVERAQRDEAYRAALLADAAAAVAEELGIEIPANLRITVIEEGADEVVLVLPASTGSVEISDEELAGVAGGWGSDTCASTNGTDDIACCR